ncbi:alkaline phosphatase [Acaricomes phytoseiuli]|uniref:alkaline phosphatase n=1 Tax=Acaricomes phytoseiuli TaxID=291968 RepID=UPI001FDF93C7|nr:alkaline phosphatase [Acaricomes phytoseiuli]MCW1250161.1 alkaline phosphatase [Acaricomes phytoseiuli]
MPSVIRPILAGSLAAAMLLAGTAAAAQAADISAPGGAQRNDGDRTADLRASIQDRPAQNVILFIGDGMGDSEITSARNYQYGAAGKLPGIDGLPLTGQYTTYALNKESKLPDYTTDSAASASAWATGTKTYNGGISVDVNEAPQRTMLQIAKANGLKTGNVTTSELQDATPAAQGANVTSRRCYGPTETTRSCPMNALENGGKGSISEQLLDTRADITLGGGKASFEQTATAGQWQGQTLLDQATQRGYHILSDAAGLDGVNSADQNSPVLGLFASGNLATQWTGPAAVLNGGTMPPVTCQPNSERPADMPSLAQMTTKSIDLLKGGNGDKGFFLQVEGASIDKQNHATNPCGQIGETIGLDDAVQKGLEFAKADGNTLVIVTADHGHSSQIIYPNSNTPGLTRTLTTTEGAPMTMAYGTAPEGKSQMHTGTQIRVAGYGPGAANVSGLTDQTDVFFTVTDALQLDRNATGGGGDPTPTATATPTTPSDGGGSGGSGDGSGAGGGSNGNSNGAASGGQQGANGSLAITGAQPMLFLAIAIAALITGSIIYRTTRRSRGSFQL